MADRKLSKIKFPICVSLSLTLFLNLKTVSNYKKGCKQKQLELGQRFIALLHPQKLLTEFMNVSKRLSFAPALAARMCEGFQFEVGIDDCLNESWWLWLILLLFTTKSILLEVLFDLADSCYREKAQVLCKMGRRAVCKRSYILDWNLNFERIQRWLKNLKLRKEMFQSNIYLTL